MPEAARRYGSNRLGGDHAGLAHALGAHAERVERPAEIAAAVARARQANAAGRPALLEMVTREERGVPEVLARHRVVGVTGDAKCRVRRDLVGCVLMNELTAALQRDGPWFVAHCID